MCKALKRARRQRRWRKRRQWRQRWASDGTTPSPSLRVCASHPAHDALGSRVNKACNGGCRGKATAEGRPSCVLRSVLRWPSGSGDGHVGLPLTSRPSLCAIVCTTSSTALGQQPIRTVPPPHSRASTHTHNARSCGPRSSLHGSSAGLQDGWRSAAARSLVGGSPSARRRRRRRAAGCTPARCGCSRRL